MSREEQIEILLTKGVEQILPSRDFLLKKLSGNERLRVYAGFDPTAPTLHIGHAIQLRKLRHFQDLGHEVIFLVGDFTARVGDPTDKLATRKQLSQKEIKNNMRLYKQQAAQFIRFKGKNAAKIKFNNKWLAALKFADILSLAANMTVEQMLKRDMFSRRIVEEKPIFLHEFFYPLMQGYDSVAMSVDGEVGGNDQLFNMMVGRNLLKQIKGKEKFVVTIKLLEDSGGKKMGKTEGNMIALTDTPEEIYGKVMSWTDGMIIPGFELCTDYSSKDTEEIKQLLSQGINPRDIKMRLAFEITKSVTGEVSATRAQENFIIAFQKKETPQIVKEIKGGNSLKETILLSKEIQSSSELRKLIISGAVSSTTTNKKVTLEDIDKPPIKDVYKIGKNRFLKIN